MFEIWNQFKALVLNLPSQHQDELEHIWWFRFMLYSSIMRLHDSMYLIITRLGVIFKTFKGFELVLPIEITLWKELSRNWDIKRRTNLMKQIFILFSCLVFEALNGHYIQSYIALVRDVLETVYW